MSFRRLFHYATWAAFMVTGTLFVTGLAKRGGGNRHIAAGTPSVQVHPRQRYHPPPARDVPIHIDVYEFGFAPSNTIVKVGQAVAFRGVGKVLHSITPTSKAGEKFFFDAQRHGSARPIFTEPGVFPFACAIHPQMKGTVTVVRRF
jgi:plastocyanin